MQNLREMEHPPFNPEFIDRQRVIPNDYLEYYFKAKRKIAEQEQWPPSRAEQVMEVEKELLTQYADPQRVQIPDGLMFRGGAYYSSVATSIMDAYWNDLGQTHIANVSR